MAGLGNDTRHGIAICLVTLALLAGGVSGSVLAAPGSSPVQRQVDTSYPVLRGSILRVPGDGDFQAALESAEPGDIIELEAGATFTGPFVLPRKAPASDAEPGWILIRSAAPPGALPPEGARVDPSHAAHMAILEAAEEPILSAAPGANHYRFEGIRIRPARSGGSVMAKWAYRARQMAAGVDSGEDAPASETPFLFNLVSLGTRVDRMGDMPHHIIFDRCYIHGDPVVGARRGIALNSRHTAIINSYLSDFKEVGFDSQAILGWNGPGPFKIVNNYLEAAGENIMFGSAVPRMDGLVPGDIEIRGNHLAKPLRWKIDHPTFEGTAWTVKNLLELKNAERVLIEGNLLEYAWPHAQNGFAVLFTVRNQHGDVPWATVSDVTFRNNVVRHASGGINILGLDDNGHPSRKSRRLVIDNNLFLSIGDAWGGGTLFQLLKSTEEIAIRHNTAEQTGKIILTDGKGRHDGFRFTDNVMPHNAYGIIGTGTGVGLETLRRDFPDAVVTDNVFIGGDARRYPAGNAFPAASEVPDPASGTPDGEAAGVDPGALCAALDVAEPSLADHLALCRDGP